MALFKDDLNKNDLWTKKELLQSTYEPGMPQTLMNIILY